MATIVRGTLVSNSVKLLLEKLVSTEFVDNFRSTKLDVSYLKKLKTTLTWVQDILNDAEEQQFTNPDIKNWLNTLRYDVFEVANLFDEINSEALRRKAEAEYETLTSSSLVLKTIFSSFKRLSSVINFKMQKFIERLEWSNSALQQGGLGVFHSSSFSQEFPTSSILDDESSIYGRECDKIKLRNLLLSSSGGDGKIRMISIVGMGGIGKTTLAKLLYNDPQVKDKFELKVWAYISKDFDVIRVLETILESITSQSISRDDPNSQLVESLDTKTNGNGEVKTIYQNILIVKLQQILSTKKFLLVLDDVLDAKSVDWIYLMDIFNAGKTGSRIIITTRDERVALSMQTFVFVHYLRPMESKDCWSIVTRLAFGAHYQQQMDELDRKIAKKCDGVPLAAVVLGRALFHAKFAPNDEWDFLLGSNIWDLGDYKLKAALHSSYIDDLLMMRKQALK